MPDKVRVNEELGVIEVDSFGNVVKNDIAQSIASVRDILAERNISKILVDARRQEAMPSTQSIFELFSTFPREFKVAILIAESQMTSDDLSFVETVSMNRGISIRGFAQKEQALQWLDC